MSSKGPHHWATLSLVCDHNHDSPSVGCEGGGGGGGGKGAIWLEDLHVWQAKGVGNMAKTKPAIVKDLPVPIHNTHIVPPHYIGHSRLYSSI